MKKLLLYSIFSFASISLFAQNQPQIPNGGFETWAGSGNTLLPTGYHSNKDGSSTAQIGAQTAFQETTNPHGGTNCVRIETVSTNIIVTTVVVNGSLTTGYVNAPSTNKADGYLGTQNYTTPTEIRRMDFDGRPDSLVGYFRYTQGGSAEKAKVTVVLHKDHFNDPENANGGNTTANRIARATYVSNAQNYNGWTRFSVPFVYDTQEVPTYIMINATSSNDQMTNVGGSKLWLDDLQVIYNPATPTGCAAPSNLVVTNNTTSISGSWTAPTPAPTLGYFYAVTPTGTTPTQADYTTSVPTSFTNVTATTGANSAPFVNGSSYTVTVMAVCAHAANGYSTTIAKDIVYGTASVENLIANKVAVYNTENTLVVDLSAVTSENVVLTVTDLTGKVIVTKTLSSAAKNEVEVAGNGIYLYSIKANDFSKTGKLKF